MVREGEEGKVYSFDNTVFAIRGDGDRKCQDGDHEDSEEDIDEEREEKTHVV